MQTNILRDYQSDLASKANELLRVHHIAYLSMEVRTGKTLTALAAAAQYGAHNVWFITKKKAIASIQGDYDKLAPTYSIQVFNYEQVDNMVAAATTPPDFLILDEAHSLGQYPKPSDRVVSMVKMSTGLPIIYLSGTPTPESYSQLYHQFYVSSYSPFAQYNNFYKWSREYVEVKTKYFYNREVKDYSGANKDKVLSACQHLFLSYSQKDAGFEQDVKEEIIIVPMQPHTYNLVKRLNNDKVYVGQQGQEILADTAVKLMGKMHQIYSGTVICENGDSIVFDRSKAAKIKELFSNQKIAIFYKFKAELQMLKDAFGAAITESPEEFNAAENFICALQIQSGREGVNLSTADALVMLNIDFASVSYWQARARMQTKDRTKEAKLYWMFAHGGIELKIYEAVLNKKDYTLTYFRKDFKIRKAA